MSIHKSRQGICGFQIVLLLLVILLAVYPLVAQTSTPDRAAATKQTSLEIPAGTVLPVRINHSFSSKNAIAGQWITGRVMQDVPLPNNAKIPEGAKILGAIVSVEPATKSNNGKLSFRFDKLEIHHLTIPLATNLRALAGFMEVQEAQTPEATPGFGTPYPWVTTRQIGGDEVYGVGGPVTDESSHTVGKAVFGGVLVHVRAQPGAKCRGALDDEDRLQALWVFSSDACGLYGMSGVSIEHAGRTEPTGEIVLTADRRDVLVRGGSGMLLRVIQ
jgi:hypothetical protein